MLGVLNVQIYTETETTSDTFQCLNLYIFLCRRKPKFTENVKNQFTWNDDRGNDEYNNHHLIFCFFQVYS